MGRLNETLMLVSSRGWGWLQERLFHIIGRWVPFLSEDVFISYSRADGSRYATGLAGELARHQFNCIIDVFAAETGRDMPPNLSRALRRARQLVVLATEGAVRSEGVAWEVARFPSEGRSVVIVGFCDSVKQAPWFLPGFDPQREPSERLVSGEPSPEIVRTILQAYTFKTQRQRLTRFAVGVGAMVIAGLAITGALGVAARNARQETTLALAKLQRAREQLTDTEKQVGESARKLAESDQKLAETGQQLRLIEARRTALDLGAVRRAEGGYTPPRDVVRGLSASRDLADLGLDPYEGEALLRESVTLLPRLVAAFRIPKGRIALAGDPPRLFVATGDNAVRVWDPSEGHEVGLTSPRQFGSTIRNIEAAGGGRWLLITAGSEVSLWDPAALTSTPVARESCRRGGRAGAAAVNPDGTMLAVACDPYVQLTDLRTNPRPATYVSWESRAFGFSPLTLHLDEKVLIVVGEHESSAFKLDPSGEVHRMNDRLCGPGMLLGVSADASAIVRAVSPAEAPEKDYRVCRTRSIKQDDSNQDYFERDYAELRAPRLDAEERGVSLEVFKRGPVFSGDGKYIAIPSVANVRVFESASGKGVGVVHARPDMSSLVVSFNGDFVVLVTSEGEVQTWETQPFNPGLLTDEPTERLWLTETRAVRGTFDDGFIRRLTESEFPRGPTHVTCVRSSEKLRCDRKGALWEGLALVDLGYRPKFGWVGLERAGDEYRASRLEPQTELCRWKAESEYELSADGRLATSTDGQFRVLDLTNRCRPRLPTGRIERREIESVFSAPEGPVLVVRSNSCTIRLVKLESGEPLANIDECAWEATLSLDGRLLAASGTSEVGVWDLRSGKRIARRTDVLGYRTVSMSPDQRYVLIHTNGRINVWRWQRDDLGHEVCHVLDRNLEAAQFRERISRDELASACTTPGSEPRSQTGAATR